MIIEIQHPITREKIQEVFSNFNKSGNRKSIRKHFGKLKRNLDALEYQKRVRDAWN